MTRKHEANFSNPLQSEPNVSQVSLSKKHCQYKNKNVHVWGKN